MCWDPVDRIACFCQKCVTAQKNRSTNINESLSLNSFESVFPKGELLPIVAKLLLQYNSHFFLQNPHMHLCVCFPSVFILFSSKRAIFVKTTGLKIFDCTKRKCWSHDKKVLRDVVQICALHNHSRVTFIIVPLG